MFGAWAGVRSAARAAARSAANFRPQNSPLKTQQRWATYQRFPLPNRGGRETPKYSKFAPFARAQYIWYNYQTGILVTGVAGGSFYVYNLEQVPVTHRRRFNWVTPELEKSMMGADGYEQIIQQYKGKILPENHPHTKLVERVVSRLLPSTGGLAGDDWKVHVIDEPNQINAFVIPGGKVFVFTGILPICQDENGLAAVLGHEIAHNVAHHAAERISRQVFIMAASIAGSMFFDVSGQFSSYVSSLILELPNSRTQEIEADHIGLLMMAESCYDPSTVPDFWKRMAQAEKAAVPQFLSTHPTSYNRVDSIKGWLPEAKQKYEQSGCGMTTQYHNEFKNIFGSQQDRAWQQTVGGLSDTRRDNNDWF